MHAKPDLTTYIGKHVTVQIDRPLGSLHPRHPDMLYPVNYGYVPDTTSGDGMPVDAYVLGIDEAVDNVEGVVIAVVVRSDDLEDKIVVAPLSHSYSNDEISRAVAFQEQYFQSRVLTTRAGEERSADA